MRLIFALLTSVFVAATLSFAETATKVATPATPTKITFTNKLIDGKKVWVPSTTDIKTGEDLEITLVNPLAEPHGFAMTEVIGADVVVDANGTKTVKGKAPKSGEFKFHCQLHPVHVGGALHAK